METDRNSTAKQKPPRHQFESLIFFAALSLFLSTLEYLFPKPIPFFRIGLSNLPLLLALDIFPLRMVLFLAFLKVAGQGLVNGTLSSYVFLFSLTGTAAGTAAMLLIRSTCRKYISLLGTSLFGALCSNLIQVFLAVTFIFGESAWVIAPLLLGLGLAGGSVVGIFAQRFSTKSSWYKKIREYYAADTL
jgi:heptaprenyl diphosphate synthase